MIEIRDVRVAYGALAVLRDVSLSLAAGERMILTGPNGAGKTTLLRCLLGQVEYSGTVRVGGLDAARAGRAVRRLVGYVPQLPAFPPGLDVGEVVAFFQRLRGEPAAPMPLLNAVGLSAAAGRAPAVLSGGMTRRLALALALIGDPPVLLLDEPASSLDAGGEAELRRWLDPLRSRQRTVLLTSHRVGPFRDIADRVAVLREGRIAADLPLGRFLDARPVALTVTGREDDLRTVAARAPVEAVALNGALHLTTRQADLPAVLAALDGPAFRRCRLTVDVDEPAPEPAEAAHAAAAEGRSGA